MLASFLIRIPGQRTECDSPEPAGTRSYMLGDRGSLVLGKRQGALVPWASCLRLQGCPPQPAVLMFPRI